MGGSRSNLLEHDEKNTTIEIKKSIRFFCNNSYQLNFKSQKLDLKKNLGLGYIVLSIPPTILDPYQNI